MSDVEEPGRSDHHQIPAEEEEAGHNHTGRLVGQLVQTIDVGLGQSTAAVLSPQKPHGECPHSLLKSHSIGTQTTPTSFYNLSVIVIKICLPDCPSHNEDP